MLRSMLLLAESARQRVYIVLDSLILHATLSELDLGHFAVWTDEFDLEIYGEGNSPEEAISKFTEKIKDFLEHIKQRGREAVNPSGSYPEERWFESSPRNQLKWETEVSDPEERWLLERLWNAVSSRAADLGVKIKEAKVTKFDNPEEDEIKTILQLTCYEQEQAFALWDSLGDLFNDLNSAERDSLLAKIGLRIYY